MNILFVHDHVLRKKENEYYSTGGLSENVMKRYLENNDKIYLYTRVKNINDNSEKDSKLIKVNTDEILCVPSKFYSSPKDYYLKRKEILKEVNGIIKNIDFAIIRLPSVLGGIILKKVEKLKIPYVVEMVACPWDALWNYGNLKGKLSAPFMCLKTKIQIKKAKNVVYVSSEFLQKRYPTKGNQINCSNVNIEEVKEEVLNKRLDKIENKKDIFKIGLIGNLNVKYKGHETALKMLKNLQNKNVNAELHFLGAGEKKELEEKAKKLNIEKKVFFDGTLPNGEPVYNWMDNMDIFIIPSLQEGLPRALIEAMSRGCPCVGAKTGGIPELLEDEFIFNKKDYKAMAKIVENLLEDKTKMKKIAERNYNEAKLYVKDLLNERRKQFFKKCREE